jgi:hypothetical protein
VEGTGMPNISVVFSMPKINPDNKYSGQYSKLIK